MTAPQISIIIPVYNVASFIPQCIECLKNQTFQDWEAIFVDDGSTDASGQVLRTCCEGDTRFRVLSKPNGGVGSARNFGIRDARGHWITFIDPDDYLDSGYYENFMRAAAETPQVDILGGAVRFVDEKGASLSYQLFPPRQFSGDIVAELKKVGYARYLDCVWDKLFRRDIVGEARFLDGVHPGEDVEFAVNCFSRSRGFSVIKTDSAYNYRQHPGQVMQNITIARRLRFVKVFEALAKRAESSRLEGVHRICTDYAKTFLLGGRHYKGREKWRYCVGVVADPLTWSHVLPWLKKFGDRKMRIFAGFLVRMPKVLAECGLYAAT